MSSAARLRRKAEDRFRRQTGSIVITHLFEAGTRVAGKQHADVIARAIKDFCDEPSGCCFACRDSRARPAAFLVAHAVSKPRGAALAFACHQCWSREDYLQALSDAAEVTLHKLLPGRWLTPLPADTS